MARCRCLLFIWNIKPLDTEVDHSWLDLLEKSMICFLPFFFFHFFSALHRLQQKRVSSTQVVVEWCFFWGWLMKAAAHKNQKCSCSSDKRCWLSCWSALWLLAHLLFLLFFLGVLCLCVCLWTCVVSALMWWAVFLWGVWSAAPRSLPTCPLVLHDWVCFSFHHCDVHTELAQGLMCATSSAFPALWQQLDSAVHSSDTFFALQQSCFTQILLLKLFPNTGLLLNTKSCPVTRLW